MCIFTLMKQSIFRRKKKEYTIENSSHMMYRHNFGLGLIQTRAHYNSHNNPDLTLTDPSHDEILYPSQYTIPYIIFNYHYLKFTLHKRNHHRLCTVTGPTDPATRVATSLKRNQRRIYNF